jgi:NADPH:quinone reductase-like Zn-dependent oxidoreductase
LVDERIVRRKPKSLTFEEAAAMPLTTTTAWEATYDRLSLYSDIIRGKTAAPSRPTTITTSTDVATGKGRRHP